MVLNRRKSTSETLCCSEEVREGGTLIAVQHGARDRFPHDSLPGLRGQSISVTRPKQTATLFSLGRVNRN